MWNWGRMLSHEVFPSLTFENPEAALWTNLLFTFVMGELFADYMKDAHLSCRICLSSRATPVISPLIVLRSSDTQTVGEPGIERIPPLECFHHSFSCGIDYCSEILRSLLWPTRTIRATVPRLAPPGCQPPPKAKLQHHMYDACARCVFPPSSG